MEQPSQVNKRPTVMKLAFSYFLHNPFISVDDVTMIRPNIFVYLYTFIIKISIKMLGYDHVNSQMKSISDEASSSS